MERKNSSCCGIQRQKFELCARHERICGNRMVCGGAAACRRNHILSLRFPQPTYDTGKSCARLYSVRLSLKSKHHCGAGGRGEEGEGSKRQGETDTHRDEIKRRAKRPYFLKCESLYSTGMGLGHPLNFLSVSSKNSGSPPIRNNQSRSRNNSRTPFAASGSWV